VLDKTRRRVCLLSKSGRLQKAGLRQTTRRGRKNRQNAILTDTPVAARQGRQGRRRLPAVRIKLNFFMGITYTYLKNISIYIYSSLFTLLSIGKICVGIKKSTPTIIIIPQSRTRTQATFNLRLKNESTIAHYLARSTLSI
jgi:hypothetical protein